MAWNCRRFIGAGCESFQIRTDFFPRGAVDSKDRLLDLDSDVVIVAGYTLEQLRRILPNRSAAHVKGVGAILAAYELNEDAFVIKLIDRFLPGMRLF